MKTNAVDFIFKLINKYSIYINIDEIFSYLLFTFKDLLKICLYIFNIYYNLIINVVKIMFSFIYIFYCCFFLALFYLHYIYCDSYILHLRIYKYK